jgi:hypothetical protein
MFSAPALCKAFAAIDGLVGLGLKGDLSGTAALCADGVEHYALTAVVAGGLAVVPACFAAGGFVPEALFGVELLLTGGENEFGAAILANQYFVFKHGKNTSDIFLILGIGSADLVFAPTLACWRVRY